jgi:hypothetical protein
LGQRERRRRAAAGEAEPAPHAQGYARQRAKEDAARAELEPLAPGERPPAVTVAAVVAVILAVAVMAGTLTGNDLSDRGGSLQGGLLIAGVLVLAAYGMWKARYWAVLGFQAFLAFQILVTSLALAVASSWYAALFCVVVIGLSGWLFWKLIRSMARLQMPERGVS